MIPRKPKKPINRDKRAKEITFPSPVRGLNGRDSLAFMKPGDAVQMDNIVPYPAYCQVRRGRTAHATGFAAAVETLMPYTAQDGTHELFAAAGTAFYDASVAGAIGAAVVSGLTNAYWQSVQFSNTGGNYLLCCNGVDNAQIYNGAAWANFGGTGLALTDITQFAVWKRRLWVVEKNSMSAWYLAVDAIAGALTEFPFQGIFKRGGSLVALVNWSLDGGAGPDDYLVAITSQGEAAVYQGLDPTDPTTFALVGVYFIGSPVGTRFYAQLGGDVILLTDQGLVPLSKFLQSSTVNKTTLLSDRIEQLISDDIAAYGSVQGWELHVYPGGDLIVIQVPSGSVGNRYQWVMCLLNQAWCRFLHNVAITWCVQDDTLYMGETTQVNDAWSGGTDNGDPIPYYVVPAFSYFGSPSRVKRFTLGRVLFECDQTPQFRWLLLTDFNREFIFAPLAPLPTQGNLWDLGIWDGVVWGTATVYSKSWFAIAGLGNSAALAIYGISQGAQTRLLTFDYAFEEGGLL